MEDLVPKWKGSRFAPGASPLLAAFPAVLPEAAFVIAQTVFQKTAIWEFGQDTGGGPVPISRPRCSLVVPKS